MAVLGSCWVIRILSITSAAGAMLVSEVDRVLGVAAVIDAAVGPIKSRRQGHGAGGLMLSLAEMMLTGGDFLADLDVRRADEAAAGLRAVSVAAGVDHCSAVGPPPR